MTTGFTPDTKRLDYYDEDGFVWVTIADLQSKSIGDSFKKVSKKYIQEKEPTIVKQGSLLYSFKLSVGQVAFAERDLYTNEAIASFIKTDKVCLPYLYYSAPLFIINNANENIYGAKLLNQDLINNAITLFPPLSEQKAIAKWLDVKCGKIDKLIATQQRRIELLQELRQGIITRAVTRGINPDVTMKASGIEWIGNIPAHWYVCRIKDIIEAGKDGIKIGPFGSSLTGKVGADLPYKIYGQWNIVGADFNAGTNTIDEETFKLLGESYSVSSGDILISMMGTIGKCATIPQNIPQGIMDSHVVKIRINENVILPKFFEYLYDKDNSAVIFNELQKMKGGSIMDGLNSSIIKGLSIPIPPLTEQREIVAYVKREARKVDHALKQAERQIELLQELRQSVITEVVTGKRKVC